MIDANGVEIQVGDLIVYGYGFNRPVLGIVTRETVQGFSYLYEYVDHYSQQRMIESSICKKPRYSIVVTNLANNGLFIQAFGAELLIKENGKCLRKSS